MKIVWIGQDNTAFSAMWVGGCSLPGAPATPNIISDVCLAVHSRADERAYITLRIGDGAATGCSLRRS
jgi:hypothetical protein